MTLSTLCLAGSLAFNAALLALFVAGSGTPAPARIATPASPVSSTALPPLTPALWQGVQTGDLPTMITRLRAAGFPPDRIRAVIGAQVHALFAARRHALDVAEDNLPYWRAPANLFTPSPARRAINHEEREMLVSLLGIDASDLTPLQRQFPSFSPEKLARIDTLQADYIERRNALVDPFNSVSTPPLGAGGDKVAALEREYHASLAALLTPRELEEFELRASNTADNLNDEIALFHPNEAEFRAIFALQHAYDLQFSSSGNTLSADQRKVRQDAEEKLSNDIHAAIGDARFAEYERAGDTGYQQLTAIATRLNLPPETAAQIWPVKLELEERANQLRANRQLPAEERTRQLAALAEEAKTKLGSALTPRGFEAYRNNSSGWWLRQLTPP